MKNKETIKVGPITLALGLIIGGLFLLLYNFGGIDSLQWLWRLWPVLLIGLGVEYFVRRATIKEREINFHVPSILLMVLLVFASGTAAFISIAGDKIGSFIDSGFWWDHRGSSYKYSWSWSGDPVDMDAGTDSLQISQQTGTVTLVPSEDGKLHVSSVNSVGDETTRRILEDDFHPKVTREGQLVEISIPRPEMLGGKKVKVDLTVKVPAGVPVAASGKLGRINCSELANDVRVSTDLGAVELRSIDGNIDARTKSGEVKIFDPTGDVTAETDLGQVTFRSAEPVAGHYSLKSNLGSINFQVPGESDLTIDASSDVGDINVSAPSESEVSTTREGPSHEAHFRLGEGKGSAVIEVNTGAINISVN